MNESKWSNLMSNMGFEANTDTFNSLKARYGEKHRAYHNETHIDAVLAKLEETRHLAKNYNAIEMALWFHDAIYEIFSSTNEEDSAILATNFLNTNGAEPTVSQCVYSLIKATEHNHLPADNDEQLIVDIDLAVLGSSPDDYDQFETNIRNEYKLVPWFIYRKKRVSILRTFLSRESIYSHSYYREKLESNARENIERAIVNLQNS